jgi:hypothetical protein
VADQETLLIHVIAVPRLYAIFIDLLPQNIEIVPERMLLLSLVPFKIESVEISAVKDRLVSTPEVRRPVFARLRSTYSGGPAANHCRHRRQAPLTKPL